MTRDRLRRPPHHCRTVRERRSGKRLLCSDLIRVKWLDESGAPHEEIAIIEDLAPTGASLFMGLVVPCGVTVTLGTREGDFTGEVRHCAPAPNGYLIGVAVKDGWQGRASGFTPEHLLDVARLDFSK